MNESTVIDSLPIQHHRDCRDVVIGRVQQFSSRITTMADARSGKEIELITVEYMAMRMAEMRGKRRNKAEHQCLLSLVSGMLNGNT